ncbi:hypothetical protein C1H46_029115 [Malus baccata]|uniref:Uncharacterized protein n=1 Tax=Malus baccata TaxID=106549 RepID=A0A540LFT8_MALBA|nr:hypothetical protein C1H46_029115 [Malus baccata]
MRLLTVNPTKGNPVRSCYTGMRVCYNYFLEGCSCVKLLIEAEAYRVSLFVRQWKKFGLTDRGFLVNSYNEVMGYTCVCYVMIRPFAATPLWLSD